MKLVCIVAAIISYSISSVSPPTYGEFIPVFTAAFTIYGIAKSLRKKINPLNDAPNAFRVLLASAGGGLIALTGTFILPSAGLILVFASLYLNDEFQRRTIDSIRRGRSGGSVALLGIDGSGKSSHALLTMRWLEERGYRCVLMPFHKYLFVEKFSSARSSFRGRAPPRGGNPLRPLLSFVDNLLLQLFSSFGCGMEGTVVIYDRFMWSTFIKYSALGYPVRPLSTLYLMPRPRCAVVLDVPVGKSLDVINSRVSHIRYQRQVLETERRLYLSVARKRRYPVIDATRESNAVQLEIEDYLSKIFSWMGDASR